MMGREGSILGHESSHAMNLTKVTRDVIYFSLPAVRLLTTTGTGRSSPLKRPPRPWSRPPNCSAASARS